MIKLLTLKLKIIIAFGVVIFSLLIAGYIYLNKMDVTSANLNINKTNPIDKLCNYSVFNDFYYRVVDYKNNENSFAQLTPIKTDICYNFKTNKIDLVSNVSSDSIIIDDNNGNKENQKLRILENFQEEYSKIVTTQDKDYFDASYKLAQKTYHSLYKEDIPIKKINLDSEFYTKISNLPIDNLVVNYFKLTEIKNPPKQAFKDAKWQPNILEWNFGENDRIYLQYLTKFKHDDLEDFVKDKYAKLGKTIVRLTKFNNNKLSKMFLIFDDQKNKITALFMDNNGYVYNLILNVQNKKAFKTYFNDFMKIAYGIYFVKKDGFINKWAEQQNKQESNLANGDESKVIGGAFENIVCQKALDDYLGDNLLNHFSIKKAEYELVSTNGGEYECQDEKYNQGLIFVTKFKTTKKQYDDYFKHYNNITSNNDLDLQLHKKDLLLQAIKRYKVWTDSSGKEKLIELCPEGNFQCVENLMTIKTN